MKKLVFMLCVSFLFVPFHHAAAQKDEIMQLTLNIQKLNQLKKVLEQIKDGYKILEGGYNTVIGIAKGNYNIHKTHLDGLLNVSPAVRNYQRVGTIIRYQQLLLTEYRRAYQRFGSGGNFRPDELAYMTRVYNNLLNQSLKNLNELTTILTAGKTRMSDDERLKAIDRIYFDMENKLGFLREFNNTTGVLELQRATAKRDIDAVRSLHGIQN